MKKIILIFALLALSFTQAQPVEMPAMPAAPYWLPNHYGSPWTQYSWLSDYCNRTTQDFLVLLEPDACQPNPVRSDLLEEQDVPVMCRLTAVKINPLIQVPYIIRVQVGPEGKVPKGVAGINFWPAQAALSYSYWPPTKETELEGIPSMNNLGYLWIQLARQPVEAKMPDKLKLNLSARIEYDVARTYGIVENQLVLPLLSQEDWLKRYKEFSFWRGKGYVRLLNFTGPSSAKLGIYWTPQMAPIVTELYEGETSEEIMMPWFYCGAGLRVKLEKLLEPKPRAKLLVNGNEYIVGEDENIPNMDCFIDEVNPGLGYGGTVMIRCPGMFEQLSVFDYSAKLAIKDQETKEVSLGDELELHKEDKKLKLYVGFINKVLTEEGLQDVVLLFSKSNFEKIEQKKVQSTVKAIHDFMRLRRGAKLPSRTELDKELKEWLKPRQLGPYDFYLESKAATVEIEGIQVKVIAVEGPEQVSYSKEVEKAYQEALNRWRGIAHEYAFKESPEGVYYGIMALKRAADLADSLHKQLDQAQILKELIEKYSTSEDPLALREVEQVQEELRQVIAGAGKRHTVISRPSGSFVIELLDLMRAADQYARLEVDGKQGTYYVEDTIDSWEIEDITESYVEFKNITGKEKETVATGKWAWLGVHKVKVLSTTVVKQAKVTILPPEEKRVTETNFSVTIGIEKRAIKLNPEQTKELIKKINSTIAKLESATENIGKVVEAWKKACYVGGTALWAKNFVTGLSGKALARKLVMKAWTERCADPVYRKKIQEEKGLKPVQWTAEGGLISLHQCYRAMENEINSDIGIMQAALNKVNDFIKEVKAEEGVVKKGGLFGLSQQLDSDKFIQVAQAKLDCSGKNQEECKKIEIACVWKEGRCQPRTISRYKRLRELTRDEREAFKEKTVDGRPIKDLTEEEFKIYGDELVDITTPETLLDSSSVLGKLARLHDKGWLFASDVKNIYLDLALYNICETKKLDSSLCSSVLRSSYEKLSVYQDYAKKEEQLNEAETIFGKRIARIEPKEGYTVSATVFVLNKSITPKLDEWFTPEFLNELIKKYGDEKAAVFAFGGNIWLAILETYEPPYYNIKEYIPLKAVEFEGKKLYEAYSENEKKESPLAERIKEVTQFVREVKEVEPERCQGNRIIRGLEPGEHARTIKFWETGPYQGKPAYLPLDLYDGWYLATLSYTGLPDQELVAWKESGELNFAYICNVGPDGIPNFDFLTGKAGDDCCTTVFFMQGVLPEITPDESRSRALYELALTCTRQAIQQFKPGVREIKTKCGTFKLSKPPVARPAMQCEDFMSPTDCRIMYNLCDPVMCPTSRCDFGGRFPVENVVQTGIIGSILLCWPNFESGKGVLVPICLTGVHAGLDTLTTIFKSGRDCLQEQLSSGQTIGICDQIMSLYLCEFLWRQFDPFIRAGIPSLTEALLHRGGGEYAMFSESWQSAMDSIRYFTDYYAKTSIQAFKTRSTREFGTEICKRFVSVRYPTQAKFFEELSKPESPTQAFACFQEIPLGGPSTDSHYKVWFHIYAGKDNGVYYQLFLRRPPAPGYYPKLPQILVKEGIGYLPAGNYISKTPDFTAPSGYKEICIVLNGKEYCGFGDCASTSFAVSEFKNLLVKDQVKQEITKTEECISGKPTLLSGQLISGNLQAAAEAALHPQIYRRGIVRVCSTQNPGAATEPDRWKRVGYCGSPDFGCWLDTKSLEEAVTDLKVKAELLDYAQNKSLSWAIKEYGLDTPEESRAKLEENEKEFNEIKKKAEDTIETWREEFEKATAEGRKTLKEDYTQELGKIIPKLEQLRENYENISKYCARADEKVRADWKVAELLSLKAKLLSLADLIEIEKKVEEEVKLKRCKDLKGEWKPKPPGCGMNEVEVSPDQLVEEERANHPNDVCCVPVEKKLEPEEFVVPWTGKTEIKCENNHWVIILDRNFLGVGRDINLRAITDGEFLSYGIAEGERLRLTIYHSLYDVYTEYKGEFELTDSATLLPRINRREKVSKGEEIITGKSSFFSRPKVEFYIYTLENGKRIDLKPALFFDLEKLEEALTKPLPKECLPNSTKYEQFYQLMKERRISLPEEMLEKKLPGEIESALLVYKSIIMGEAVNQRIPWQLLASLLYHESRGNPKAVSQTGCAGLAQFTYKTATDYKKIFEKVFPCKRGAEANWICSKGKEWCCDPSDGRFDPVKSIKAAAVYLRSLIDQFNRYTDKEKFAVASYNVGVGTVKKAIEKTGKSDPSWEEVKQYLRDTTLPENYVENIFKAFEGFKKEELREELKEEKPYERCKGRKEKECLALAGECWWDSAETNTEKACKSCKDQTCQGKPGFFAMKDLFSKEDCEKGHCGLDCVWAKIDEKEGCYEITNGKAAEYKVNFLTTTPVEQGKEESRIAELQRLRELLNRHIKKIGNVPSSTVNEWIYRLELNISLLKRAVEERLYGKPLSEDQLKQVETDYREYVPTAVEKIINEGKEYDCADFAIALLEDFVENYEELNLNLVLYNDDGSVTKDYRARVGARHLAVYNTEPIELKDVKVGDMLIYNLTATSLHSWHTLVIGKIIDHSIYGRCYWIFFGNMEEGQSTPIRNFTACNTITNIEPYEDYYKNYVEWFTEKGKYLYEDKPRRWNFTKILRVKEIAA